MYNWPKNKIEIKPTGSYFDVDPDGYLINPTSQEKIQSEWKPVVDDVVGLYRKKYGNHVKSIYIRGSVAKGEAIDSISDIDAFAYIDLPKAEMKRDTIEERNELKQKYSFVNGIEMQVSPMSEIGDNLTQTSLINQSICVFGEAVSVPKIKAGREAAINSPTFHNRFHGFESSLENEEDEGKIKKVCARLMKELLRVGFEITMDRSKKYTRDLYPCYETFAEYYPDRESEMREVLDLALNPTGDKEKIKEIMTNIGTFLLGEIPKYIDVKNR